jgi:hypothetical protein
MHKTHVRGMVFILCGGRGQKILMLYTGLSTSEILPTGLQGERDLSRHADTATHKHNVEMCNKISV